MDWPIFTRSGANDKAVEIARSVVAKQRTIARENDIRLGSDLMFLAMVLEMGESYLESVAAAEEGVRIYNTVLGETHSESRRMQSFLAAAKGKVEKMNGATSKAGLRM